jgi:hypothetical protein
MAGRKNKSARARPETRAAERTHSEDGVDLTLIRWMLSLTPAKRLEVLQNNARSILRLRGETSRP